MFAACHFVRQIFGNRVQFSGFVGVRNGPRSEFARDSSNEQSKFLEEGKRSLVLLSYSSRQTSTTHTIPSHWSTAIFLARRPLIRVTFYRQPPFRTPPKRTAIARCTAAKY